MEVLFTIGEISQLFHIPASTLRFWQDKNLIQVEKAGNSYRTYTQQNVVQIADLLFYRSLGIPIKRIQEFDRYHLEQHQQNLMEVGRDLEKRIADYQSMHRAVVKKVQDLEQVAALREIDYTYGRVPFDQIVRFEFTDREKLRSYSRDVSVYVRHWNGDLSTETRGIITDRPDPQDQVLWVKEKDRTYAVFLIRELVHEDYRSDMPQKLKQVQQKHQTGTVLAQYLATSVENGCQTDFLKAYVELLD